MSTMIWVTIGITVGWACFRYLRLNVAHGLVISILVGAAAAVVGGDHLGPRLAASVHPGEFNPVALLMAFAIPAASLIVMHMIRTYFNGE